MEMERNQGEVSFIFALNYTFELWKYGKLLTMNDYHT